MQFHRRRAAADSTVVRATIALAHDLGMRVVAEGVESPAGLLRVAELGCEMVQGYWIGRPMPGERIATWLTNGSMRSAQSGFPLAG